MVDNNIIKVFLELWHLWRKLRSNFRIGGWIVPASKKVIAELKSVSYLDEESAIKFLVNKFPYDTNFNFKVESGHFDYVNYCLKQQNLPDKARSLLRDYSNPNILQSSRQIGLQQVDYTLHIAFHNVGRRNARLTKLIKSEGELAKITHGRLCRWTRGKLCSKKHHKILYQIEPIQNKIPDSGLVLTPRKDNTESKEFIAKYNLTLTCAPFSKYPPTKVKAWCIDFTNWFRMPHSIKILLKFQSEQGRWPGRERREKTIHEKVWITIPNKTFNFISKKQKRIENLLDRSYALQKFYVKHREKTSKKFLSK